MENSISGDDQKISPVTQYDEDRNDNYDDYKTPSNSKIDETTFTTPNPTDKLSVLTLQERHQIKRDKLACIVKVLK